MSLRHRWEYKGEEGGYPRKCKHCGMKELIKSRKGKRPGMKTKVDQVFHQMGKDALVEGPAPACTVEK